MNELEYVTDPGELPDSPLTHHWAPVRESFKRVKKAYEILAYPHVKDARLKECIEADLEQDRQAFGRDTIDLDQAEQSILRKLATTAHIPLNPQRHTYAYSDIPLSPHIDPYGRRHMTTEDIRQLSDVK